MTLIQLREMESALALYRQSRNDFLANVIVTLSADERFVAGWLTGSLARANADSVNDIDLNLAISKKYTSSLCTKLETISDHTSPERLSLFSQFGVPALIHENNNNAPEGGTFTFILYAESAIMVDWVLIPESNAKRSQQSKLLFDKVGIPVSYPNVEDLEQRKKSVGERWAFFWMMSMITIKYILRGDGVFVAQWIEYLNILVREVERQMNGEPWMYNRGSYSQLQSTPEKQLESLMQLCRKMQDLKPRVAVFIESEPLLPIVELEKLFQIANS